MVATVEQGLRATDSRWKVLISWIPAGSVGPWGVNIMEIPGLAQVGQDFSCSWCIIIIVIIIIFVIIIITTITTTTTTIIIIIIIIMMLTTGSCPLLRIPPNR
jgi:hypothetical protein